MSVIIPAFSFNIQQGDRWLETITLYQNKQTITFLSLDVGTTFRLIFTPRDPETGVDLATQETGSMADDVTAADMQLQLEQLPGIRAGNVSVTGSAGGPYEVSFINELEGAPQNRFDYSTDPVPDGLIEIDWVPEDLSVVDTVARIVGRAFVDAPYKLFDITNTGVDPRITLDAEGHVIIDVPGSVTADWNFETGICHCRVTLDGETRTRFVGVLALSLTTNYD